MTAASAAPASAEVISLTDERASIRRRLLQRSAREVAEKAFARAGDYDEDGAYPAEDVAALHESGLLTAVLPVKFGGAGLTRACPSARSCDRLVRAACRWGGLFEGHVNALELVLRYGNDRRVELVAEEARAGKLFGVWNTDDANGSAADPQARALLARRAKNPGLGRRPHRAPARHRDRRKRASTDRPAQAGRSRSRRSFAVDSAGHARFRDRRR